MTKYTTDESTHVFNIPWRQKDILPVYPCLKGNTTAMINDYFDNDLLGKRYVRVHVCYLYDIIYLHILILVYAILFFNQGEA